MFEATFAEEFKSSVAPSRLWKAGVLDLHVLAPKIASQFIESVEVEGDGGVGTTKTFNFTAGIRLTLVELVESNYREGPKKAVPTLRYVKNKVDVLDNENLVYKYTVVEGSEKFKSNTHQIKIEGSEDGGSIFKFSGEYITVGDDEAAAEADIKAAKEGNLNMFKGVESYLLANPNAYA
ncbi:hypothetical protein Scep_030763 [Stephania cephalantha]|uniref:Bet v I/Major latex protein domain-containing protein n=1 Tax=Stephania cephalantha TaxID=152367 RepID=A0AAP0E3P3_9MAGN